MNRTVRFLYEDTYEIVDRLTDKDRKAMWYSQKEIAEFKMTMVQDAAKISRVLDARLNLDSFSNEELIQSVGLESVLNQALNQQITQQQMVHLRRILIEQAIQRTSRGIDVDAMSRLSRNSSEWTRNRSHEIAVRLRGVDAWA